MLEALGIKTGTLIAGFVGAVVSLKLVDGNLSTMQRFTTVAAGAAVAAFAAPGAVELLALSPKLENFVAFLLGLFGMAIAGAAMNAIPSWVNGLKAKLPGGKP